MSLFMYPVQQAAETPLVPAQMCTKTCLKFTLRWRGLIKSVHCIYSIFICRLVSKNDYIWYSYSVRLWETNIFDIHMGHQDQDGEKVGQMSLFFTILNVDYIEMRREDVQGFSPKFKWLKYSLNVDDICAVYWWNIGKRWCIYGWYMI